MHELRIDGGCKDISLRQLKLFEAAGRLGSVRKAAEECSLSQPAVTQALAKLEDQVGATLLDRRSSGSYLNDMGEILHRRAVRFFTQMEMAILEFGVPGGATTAAIIAKRFSRSHLRCLIAVVEGGSFKQAAELLAINDSSLQRIARTIERNLGKPIFCSTAAGKMVTPAGELLGRKLKLALQEINWGIEEIDAAHGNSTAAITIGAMPFGGSVLLASVLDEFLSIHPDAEVKIVNESASELLSRLANARVDFVIGLMQETSSDELTFEALAKTPYTVVSRRGHPLARQSKVTIDDLLKYPWIIGTPGSSRRACFGRLFANATGPRASIATCALPVIHHLLECSDRLTLMTSYEVMHDVSSLVPLQYGAIEPDPSIGITTRANWLPTRAHSDFISLLRDRTSEYARSLRQDNQQQILMAV